MDTNKLKRFAGEARVKLKAGVAGMLRLYGFDAEGNASSMPERITGGAVFNGATIPDETFYDKWMSLYDAIRSHGVKEIYEEVAYTWFNRFMAIRIMRKNGFISPVLEYGDPELRIPAIVTDARRGNLPPMREVDRRRLQDLLLDDSRTDEQFAILIVAYCRNNPVLNACFGRIDDYTELLLPKAILAPGDFVDMINSTPFITDDDYLHSELIGWLYQFYISEKKGEVFANKEKVAEEDIPAATQIFTPNWIVKYLAQNTLGRIYLDNFGNEELKAGWKYLVPPAAGATAKLKVGELEELTLIDPGCGSGHILSEAFDMLYDMYRADLASPREACASILTRNICGIDLDTRAKQLSQFSILMKACQKDDSFLSAAVLPHILDMPEPYGSDIPLRDTLSRFFIGGDARAIDETVKAIRLMDQAKNLGSIMKFDISEKTRFRIERRIQEVRSQSPVNPEFAGLAPYLDVILALTGKYTCVVANPPYMGSGKMNPDLSKYVAANYPEGKADLFSVFMIVAEKMLAPNGKYGMINMQSWMFLSSFEKLRTHVLSSLRIDNMLHLGPCTFDELSGEVVQNTAFVITASVPAEGTCGNYCRLVDGKDCADKERMFLSDSSADGNKIYYPNVPQKNFGKIPGSPIGYWVSEKIQETFTSNRPLSAVCKPTQGLATADNGRFLRQWFEVDQCRIGFGFENAASAADSGKKWFPTTKGGTFRRWFGNMSYVVNWENDGEELTIFKGSVIRNRWRYFTKCGATWSTIASGKPSFRYFDRSWLFETKGSVCFPEREDENVMIMGYLNSSLISPFLQVLSPTLDYHEGPMGKIPYKEIGRIEHIENLVQQNISLSKSDWDAHETSWDFRENELLRIAKKERTDSLERALKCYCSEWEDKFNQLHENEEELNRQFIEIYGLQDELTPDVPLDEVTILQQGEIKIKDQYVLCDNDGAIFTDSDGAIFTTSGEKHIEWQDDVIIRQLLSYAVGCRMGRYRLDRGGLAIAHPDPSPQETAPYSFTDSCGAERIFEIDEDGLIPLLPLDCGFADNAHLSVRQFIRDVFGEESYAGNLNFVETCLGKPLEEYLFKDFWTDHKKMYQNRPIYWLFSSKKGAFKVLAYCHRMTRHTAELVRQRYLLPYIDRLKGRADEIQAKGAGASAAERRQLKSLLSGLAECEEYHTRLHAVAERQIGFDLDDGVLHNYALFGDVLSKFK